MVRQLKRHKQLHKRSMNSKIASFASHIALDRNSVMVYLVEQINYYSTSHPCSSPCILPRGGTRKDRRMLSNGRNPTRGGIPKLSTSKPRTLLIPSIQTLLILPSSTHRKNFHLIIVESICMANLSPFVMFQLICFHVYNVRCVAFYRDFAYRYCVFHF